MSGIATAIIGGAVISGAVAKGAADDAQAAHQTELGFAQQQYNDWQEIYGPIQDNLAEYYNNLSPDTYAAQGIQYAEEEFARASEALNQSLAQRGITDSGVAASMEMSNQLDLARTRADIRQKAPEVVANQQLGFLSVGMGNDPTNNLQQVHSNNANRLSQESYAANDAFAQSVGTATNYFTGQLNQGQTGASGAAVKGG